MRNFIICTFHQYYLCDRNKDEMGGACSRHRTGECVVNNSRKTCREEITCRQTQIRWENNIKRDLKEVGYEVMDCVHLVHDRIQWRTHVNTTMNFPTN
jgi:hypothetical protein